MGIGILIVLELLADNEGECLYDWEGEQLERLYELSKKLTETVRDVPEADRLYEVVKKLTETVRAVRAELHGAAETP